MSLNQQGGGKKKMAKKSKKDSLEHTHEDGTKHSHKNGDKPHEHEITSATVEVKGGKVDVYKKGAKIRFEDKIEEQTREITKPKNVYDPDYKLIDDTIEDIKKESRRVCTNDYSANNVYIFLQNCLKKISLAEK